MTRSEIILAAAQAIIRARRHLGNDEGAQAQLAYREASRLVEAQPHNGLLFTPAQTLLLTLLSNQIKDDVSLWKVKP